MEEISRQKEAIRAIRERGYLNFFLSKADAWYVAHTVPGGMSEDCAVIANDIGDDLAGDSRMERVGEGRSLSDPTCHIVWFRLRQ
jgi:hypothetical protein